MSTIQIPQGSVEGEAEGRHHHEPLTYITRRRRGRGLSSYTYPLRVYGMLTYTCKIPPTLKK